METNRSWENLLLIFPIRHLPGFLGTFVLNLLSLTATKSRTNRDVISTTRRFVGGSDKILNKTSYTSGELLLDLS